MCQNHRLAEHQLSENDTEMEAKHDRGNHEQVEERA